MYKILGSSDLIGNPSSLVSNLGTGVKDFFYEPAQGVVKVGFVLRRARLSVLPPCWASPVSVSVFCRFLR
jgi:Vacuolar-sorting-associated 13 protein, DH-like domain